MDAERILYMKFPIFASFVIFVIWLTYELTKHRRKEEKFTKSYWEIERQANSTRRKSLDDLAYITIPEGFLSLSLTLPDKNSLSESEENADLLNLHDNLETLHALSSQKIVNFTGLSNTELKLLYGAPNIPLLMEYDQNYTILARTLQNLADLYLKSGQQQEAVAFMEFAVSTHTDISKTYRCLSDIYRTNGEQEKIQALLDTAKELKSATQKSILRSLEETLVEMQGSH